jgi:hypothetical protein
MERSTSSSGFPQLLSNVLTAGSRVAAKLFPTKGPQDPDLDQIFSDAVEREMMYRELHSR